LVKIYLKFESNLSWSKMSLFSFLNYILTSLFRLSDISCTLQNTFYYSESLPVLSGRLVGKGCYQTKCCTNLISCVLIFGSSCAPLTFLSTRVMRSAYSIRRSSPVSAYLVSNALVAIPVLWELRRLLCALSRPCFLSEDMYGFTRSLQSGETSVFGSLAPFSYD